MKNRLRRALALAAVSALFVVSVPTTAFAADKASDSTVTSVEDTKETPAASAEEETKKTEEAPVAPAKEEPVAPTAPVVPVLPDPVAVPAPPVEPAPAPVVPAPAAPEPAVLAAPVAPPVETPVAAELPATPPVKDVVIDDPGNPVLVEDVVPATKVGVTITTVKDINAQGWIIISGETQPATPGTQLGTYTVNLTGAQPQNGVNTAILVAGEDGTDYTTLWWECATPGATISVTGPNGLVPIFNEIDGTTATEQTLPILGTPGCGTTTPTKTVKPVTPGAPTFNPAGPGKHGSIEYPGTVGVVYTADPVGATEGPVKVTATAAPETVDTIYVIADNAQTEWFGNLGEFSEEVPNPGIDPSYPFGYVELIKSTPVATLAPEGKFNQLATATVSVSGHSVTDGSVITVTKTFTDIDGTKNIVSEIDLSGLCGTVGWKWSKGSAEESNNPQNLLFSGNLELPAGDPSKWDDGDDNDNPGDGDSDHHDDDWWNHGGWHDGEWWNNHTGEPGNNGPTGNQNNNGTTDSSVNSIGVQASVTASQAQGGALPQNLSSENSSEDGELAMTGSSLPLPLVAVAVLVLLVLGIVAYRAGVRHPKHRMAK